MTTTKKITILEKDYLEDLNKIKETIKTNQNKAMVVVNSTMIMTYYEIGTIINQRKVWGNKYIERLSNDLQEYGKGYSYDNLNYMRRFAAEFKKHEIFDQPGRLIPWRSIIEIIKKSKSHNEMIWYIKQTHKNGWSRSMVLNQFKLKAYERSLIEPSTSEIITSSNDLTNELFKDTYVFDFIDKENIKNERDLENKLIDNITKFILELGKGFAYIGRQVKFEIPNNEYYPDLLFYNYLLHSFVIIDLKMTPYKPEYLGKMMFYVNIANDALKTEKDNPTIGLILCADADNIVIKYSFGSTTIPIKVSEYKFIEELPEYLEKKLKEIK